ncbi:MAG: beta-lactamase [Caulobacteraceae bacterium]|nr:beta-lactamase [Caulobacteraceae bacterium]
MQAVLDAWPTQAWSHGDLAVADRAQFEALLNEAYGPGRLPELGETHALLVVQSGRLAFEHYGDGFSAEQTHASWSMAKSITQALVGILVADGKLEIHAPADVPEWIFGDPRAQITLDDLLRMSSGLKFVEDYVGGGDQTSDVLEMLYGAGKADMAAYAAGLPLAHPPGAHWSYSSGTTNIVARCAARALGASGEAFHRFMRERLFEPIGMKSPVPKFDAAGTFIGSSYCFSTAEDFARFGLLYLRDGMWDGRRILPAGWVDYARAPTPTPDDADAGYGAQWWLGFGGEGSFSANGFGSQIILVLPDRDTVIVRLGDTSLAHKDDFKRWIGDLAGCFR